MNEPDLVPFNIVDESELLRPEFDIPMLITKTSTSSAAAEISPSKRLFSPRSLRQPSGDESVEDDGGSSLGLKGIIFNLN